MYESLIKRLCVCEQGTDCTNCPMRYEEEVDGPFLVSVKCSALEAADAIEELQQTVEHYKGCSDDWYKEACDYKAMLPRWIPVTEPLPPYGDRILVTDKTGVWEGYLSYSRGFMRNTGMTIKDIYDVEVTHWMPLPEPPKENGKSET